MLNINIGGVKKWDKVSPQIRSNWKVLDVSGKPDYKYDLNSELPFPLRDSSVDNYYCSHTLEHIYPQVLPFVLGEIYRTLKQSGVFRIVVPDIKKAIIKYTINDKKWLQHSGGPTAHRDFYPETCLGYLMSWFYSTPKGGSRTGHRMVFDLETLYYYLQRAGFKTMLESLFCKGSSVFAGLDFPRHKDTSIYMEAGK